MKLFYHENMRVFHDRLTTSADRDFIVNEIVSHFTKFGQEREDVLDIELVIFTDFMHGREADPRYYCPITDLNMYISRMDAF